MVDHLYAAGATGACLAEIVSAFGMETRPNSISPRFVELEKKGLICRTERTRSLPRHSAQTVWIHRDFAVEVAS